MNPKITIYIVGLLLGTSILFMIPRGSDKEAADWSDRQAPLGYYPIEYEDALGREIRLPRQPRYFISLAPSITEILFAMDMGDHLLGVTQFCRYPPEATELPRIGGIRAPNYEHILALNPDIVMGTTLSAPVIYNRFDEIGVLSIAFKHSSYEQVLDDIANIGKLLGVPDKALRLHSELTDSINAVQEAVADLPTPRTVLLYGLDGLYSAGKGSWAGDLLTACNAMNLAEEADSDWPQLNLESVAASDPEVIIVGIDPEEEAAMEAEVARLKEDPVWRLMSAVKNNRIHFIDKDLLAIPGPRMAEAMDALARAIHPEAFTVAQAGLEP